MAIIFKEEYDVEIYSSENIIQDGFQSRAVEINLPLGIDTSNLEIYIYLYSTLSSSLNLLETPSYSKEISTTLNSRSDGSASFKKEINISPVSVSGGYISGIGVLYSRNEFAQDYPAYLHIPITGFFSIDSTGKKILPKPIVGTLTLLSEIDSDTLSTLDTKYLSEIDFSA